MRCTLHASGWGGGMLTKAWKPFGCRHSLPPSLALAYLINTAAAFDISLSCTRQRTQ